MGSIAAARVAETASTATAADETDTAHTITSALLDGEGIAYKEENRDHVIVCLGPRYGIFHVAEFAVLAGLHITTLAPMLGSPHDILAC